MHNGNLLGRTRPLKMGQEKPNMWNFSYLTDHVWSLSADFEIIRIRLLPLFGHFGVLIRSILPLIPESGMKISVIIMVILLSFICPVIRTFPLYEDNTLFVILWSI